MILSDDDYENDDDEEEEDEMEENEDEADIEFLSALSFTPHFRLRPPRVKRPPVPRPQHAHLPTSWQGVLQR